MKCAFLLGSPDISGGTYVIFEHAIRMNRRGIDITIITEEKVDMNRLFWHIEANELTWETYESAKDILYDIVIATWWKTVYDIYKIKAKKYAYFVQSIESKFYLEKEVPLKKLIDCTYLLPIFYITEATWIKNYLKKNYDQKADIVLNGIRKDIYTTRSNCIAPRNMNKLRVLVEGHLGVHFKNTKKTIELCRISKADEIWLMTGSEINEYPGVDRIFSKIPIFETPKIYNSCDVIIKLSYVEGMFGPPLEMFHCRGTAIVYDVTGYDEYIKHDYNAFVVKVDDEDQVVKYINVLKERPQYLKKLKRGAIKTANEWPDWETQSLCFEKVLKKNVKTSQNISQRSLESKTKLFLDFFYIAEEYRKGLLKKEEIEKGKAFFKKIKNKINKKFKKLYNLFIRNQKKLKL